MKSYRDNSKRRCKYDQRERRREGSRWWSYSVNLFPVIVKSENMPPKSIINLTKENKILLLRAVMGSLLPLRNFLCQARTTNEVLLFSGCIKSLRPLGIHLINHYSSIRNHSLMAWKKMFPKSSNLLPCLQGEPAPYTVLRMCHFFII